MAGEETLQNEHRELFIWKKEHEQYFLGRFLFQNRTSTSQSQTMHKPKSNKIGEAWRSVVENLNNLEKPEFRVTVRSVRDRFTKMVERYKNLEKEEARASGITGAELDEVYQGMVDILVRMDDAKMCWENENNLLLEKQNLGKAKGDDGGKWPRKASVKQEREKRKKAR